MRKVVLAMLLLLLGSSYALPSEAAAATKTVMYVNAKSDIILRATPAQNAIRLGTITNYGKVNVLSSSKGWSYIQIGKNKGYVYTSALSKKNPKVKPAPTTVTGGLSPVNGLILTYSPSFSEVKTETYHVKKDGNDSYLFNKKSNLYPDLSNYTYIESRNSLLMGVSSSGVIFLDITYPLKQGKYAYDLIANESVLVESTTKTIKVKAGSFKNVIILRSADGGRQYYAKGIGLIKVTDSKGKILIELTSVKTGK